MRCSSILRVCCVIVGQLALLGWSADTPYHAQAPLLSHASSGRNVSVALFTELEELARIVDIAYCVGLTSTGISRPFSCLSRCTDFPDFELVTTWNTGPLLSDSCGYIVLDHKQKRIVVAFRGTYSITNTIVDLSTIPQEYVPYPGSDDDDEDDEDDGGEDDDTILEPSSTSDGISSRFKKHFTRELMDEPKCENCTVHMGFHFSWLTTRRAILSDLKQQMLWHPQYQLTLVGHSLGGAVAALAGLDFLARGWDPVVTTFGEPRIGNVGLAKYLDARFNVGSNATGLANGTDIKYRRVTHVNDPVPLLPLSEWSYAMHAGEIFISKPSLSPDIADLEHCDGDNDPECIAAQDCTSSGACEPDPKQDLLSSVREEIRDVIHEPWGIPSRYKLWQLFFAHRDYFWRIGLCVPGGDPLGGGRA